MPQIVHSRSLPRILALVLIAGIGITSDSSAQGPGISQTVQVRVYNDAGVSAMMLSEAISTAAKVYDKVGVIVAWLDCTSSKERRDEGCNAKLTPSTRVLRLQPHELGRAVLRADHSRGTIAYIFPNLVEDLAGRVGNGLAARLLFGRLLGYTVAHELAHLLGVRHSESGLMSPVWGRDDLDGILTGSLGLGWLDPTIFSGAWSDSPLLNGR